MTIRYRTTGAWGAGLGSDLSGAQVDENFYTLKQAVDAVAADAVTGVGISSITLVGTALTFYLTDASIQGPFAIATPRVPAPVTISAATYTLATANISQYLRCTSATGLVVTVPPNADVSIPIGSEYHWRQGPACPSITFYEGDTGVVINGVGGFDLAMNTAGAVATLKKVAEDEWDLFGHLAQASL